MFNQSIEFQKSEDLTPGRIVNNPQRHINQLVSKFKERERFQHNSYSTLKSKMYNIANAELFTSNLAIPISIKKAKIKRLTANGDF